MLATKPESGDQVGPRRREQAQGGADAEGGRLALAGRVHQGRLRHHGGDLPVAGPGDDRVPASHGAAPERHAGPVQVGPPAHEGERGLPVLELPPRIDELARPAAARAEAAVVEDEGREPAPREDAGEGRERHVAGRREAG